MGQLRSLDTCQLGDAATSISLFLLYTSKNVSNYDESLEHLPLLTYLALKMKVLTEKRAVTHVHFLFYLLHRILSLSILGLITCPTKPLCWFLHSNQWAYMNYFRCAPGIVLPLWVQIATVIWVSTVINTNIWFLYYSKLLLCISSPLLGYDNALWV